MLFPYKDTVVHLLQSNKYPVLLDYVVFNIYYKKIKPSHPSERYSYASSEPSVVYHKVNQPFKLTCFTHCSPNYFHLHYESPTELDLRSLRLECKSVRINRGLINTHLKLQLPTFEYEIYEFLTRLNFDLHSIFQLIDLTFIESTVFLPITVTMLIHNYGLADVEEICNDSESFGIGTETLEVRILEGKLSECTSRTSILSLRDHFAWKDWPTKFTDRYSPYNIHYIPDLKAVVPLAFNPLENPVISK